MPGIDLDWLRELRRTLDRASAHLAVGPALDVQEQVAAIGRALGHSPTMLEAIRTTKLTKDAMSPYFEQYRLVTEAIRHSPQVKALTDSMQDIAPKLGADFVSLQRSLEPLVKQYEVLRRVTPAPYLSDVEQCFRFGAGPTMLLRDISATLATRAATGSLLLQGNNGAGLLAIVEPDTDTDLIPVAPADATRPEQERRLRINLDVRCSRCGGSLGVRGSSYAVLSDEEVRTDVQIIPWCRCLVDWNGTAEDLLRPGAKPLLVRLDGEGLGDGKPSGNLVLVENTEPTTGDDEV